MIVPHLRMSLLCFLLGSVHVDAVEFQFGDDGVLIFRAGIDLDNLEAETPGGFVGIVVSEGTELLEVEALHAANVL